MRFYILCIFSFFSIALLSQVPGYVGKKNIVFLGGRASVIPASAYMLDTEDNVPTVSKTSFFWNAGVKRAIGRSGTMGLSGTYFQSSVFGAKASDRVPTLYSGFDVAVDFRSYYYSKKGSIAPIGKHFRYNILFSRYLLNTVENKIPVGQVMFLGLGLGAGNSRVFYDKIWVDYGWEFNLLFNVYDQQDMVSGWDYTKQVQQHLQNSYAVYFKLNVGYVY
ncbi:MAG: hypothetical protein NT150_06495 [Bacteroidetes bacterium]|nr:hypothetical protein [Bacteroidota bacterium]